MVYKKYQKEIIEDFIDIDGTEFVISKLILPLAELILSYKNSKDLLTIKAHGVCEIDKLIKLGYVEIIKNIYDENCYIIPSEKFDIVNELFENLIGLKK